MIKNYKVKIDGRNIDVVERVTQERDRSFDCSQLIVNFYPADGTTCPKCSNVFDYISSEVTDCHYGSSRFKMIKCVSCNLEGEIMYDSLDDKFASIKLVTPGVFQ